MLLGGSGATGLAFLKHFRTLPSTSRPKLTVYVRGTSKLPSEVFSHEAIKIVEGALNDVNRLSKAMQGVTVVISFLGAYLSLFHAVFRTTPTPIADSLPAIFDAMRSNDVSRILVLSTPSAFPQAGETLSWKYWFLTTVMPSVLAPQGKAEMKAIAERTSAQEDLVWTVFRVPHLNDWEEDAQVTAGLIGPQYPGGIELSRNSLVKWILDEVQEREWLRQAPMVANC